MSKKTAIIGLALVTALACASAGQASANTESGTKAQRVSYSDLDLSRSQDAHVLVGRIWQAANRVCQIDGASNLDRISNGYHRCVKMAATQAVAQLNSPMVTAAYEGKPSFEVATK
jgi:UrcA family protein